MQKEQTKQLHTREDYPYGEIVQPLLLWYAKNKRDLPWRQSADPYRVWVSEIMLQQTRVEGAKEYYKRFLEKFPTVRDLAEAEEESLLKVWEGLGYYSRARNMQKAARQVCEEYGGQFPADKEKLRGLSGIGDYTAGAIASIAFYKRTPAVDGNVFRVLSRLTANPTDISLPAYKKYLEQKLQKIYPEEGVACADFTQALMELGALVCKPTSPACESCPLKDVCLAQKTSSQDSYPVLPKKKEKRVEQLYVFVILTGDKISLRKRTEGLLKGLYEFPTASKEKGKKELLAEWGITDYTQISSSSAVHIFTHVRWEMECVVIRTENSPFEQFSVAQIEGELSLPTAFSKAKEMAVKYV
ncbi:MAG: A/G-specific adenine glycosylase [Clostridia bacterium]|nr:A/G-specific adenine glycosylase [Clostridia bacterium]